MVDDGERHHGKLVGHPGWSECGRFVEWDVALRTSKVVGSCWGGCLAEGGPWRLNRCPFIPQSQTNEPAGPTEETKGNPRKMFFKLGLSWSHVYRIEI